MAFRQVCRRLSGCTVDEGSLTRCMRGCRGNRNTWRCRRNPGCDLRDRSAYRTSGCPDESYRSSGDNKPGRIHRWAFDVMGCAVGADRGLGITAAGPPCRGRKRIRCSCLAWIFRRRSEYSAPLGRTALPADRRNGRHGSRNRLHWCVTVLHVRPRMDRFMWVVSAVHNAEFFGIARGCLRGSAHRFSWHCTHQTLRRPFLWCGISVMSL